MLSRLSPATRFVLMAALFLALFAGTYQIARPYLEDFFTALCVATANVVYASLALVGADTRISHDVVGFGGFSVRIILECTGLLEMIVFGAFVMAYPASVRAKLWGFALGFGSIYLFNVVRIVGLLAVGRYAHHLFELFHIYFWQVTLIAIIVANWLLWLQLVVHRREPAPSS